MGCICCCCCAQEEDSKTSTHKELYKNKMNDKDDDDKALLSESKLLEEGKHSFKGGESGYASAKARQKNLARKSLSKSNYNNKGLIDDNSDEFRLVKNYVKRDGFDLQKAIGSGSYAEVYKAFAPKYSRSVAVKVILLQKANRRYRKQFLPQEIKVMQHCKHKNLIKIYHISQYKNRIFVIMEFADKGTLADWLKHRGAFSEELAKVMFAQILQALHHMHSNYIAHRDLKIENILVTDKLIPKLSDFSYAMKFTPGTPMSTDHCGSLPYFAPELLQRKPYNPLISDIWSLGVCFYTMLNDGIPFPLGDDRLMLKKQLAKDWKFKKRVEHKLSEQIKTIIRRMLEPDLRSRTTSAQLTKDQWFRFHLK